MGVIKAKVLTKEDIVDLSEPSRVFKAGVSSQDSDSD